MVSTASEPVSDDVLPTQMLTDLIRRHAAASAALTNCTTFEELAAAIGTHMLGQGQYVSLNLFVYDTNQRLAGLRTLATANRRQTYATDFPIMVTQEEGGELLRAAANTDRPLFFSGLQNEPRIPARLKAWRGFAALQSVLVLPIRMDGAAVGLVIIHNQDADIAFSEAEMHLYQALTDQISVLVQLYRLTEVQAAISTISERQALAFNELVLGQDITEMARIIARHMLILPDRFLCIYEILTDSAGRLTEWKALVTTGIERVYTWNQGLSLGAKDADSELHRSLLRGEAYTLGDVWSAETRRVGPAFLDWMRINGGVSFVCAPLTIGENINAALVVTSGKRSGFSREEVNAFTSLSNQLGALLNAQRLMQQAEASHEVVDNLVLASRLISTATRADYMARGIMYTLARRLTFAAITLFDHSVVMGQKPGVNRLVAVSTVSDLIIFDEHESSLALPAPTDLERFHAGLPVVLTGAVVPSLLPQTVQVQFSQQPLTWCAVFGLRNGEELVGTLALYHTVEISLHPAEIDAYTTLADQIGVSLRIRQLLDETHQAQTIASNLVATNRVVASAESYSEMAASIINGLPNTVDLVGIMLFDNPVIIGEVPAYVVTESVATRHLIDRPRVVDSFEAHNEVIEELLGRLSLGEQLSLRADTPQSAQFPNLMRYLQEKEVASVTMIGLRAGSQLMGVLLIGMSAGRRITGAQLNNVLALADQLALTFENRRLLDQTADALGFVQSQYETTNALYSAGSPMDMLAALFAFTDGTYECAQIALLDSPQGSTLTTIAEIDGGDITAGGRQTHLGDYVDLKLSGGEALALLDTGASITEEQRATLNRAAKGAYLSLPLYGTSRRLLGVLHFSGDAPGRMPFNRTRALQNLADQLAIVLENRDLLQRTEESLEEARCLYNVNRDLLAAQDGMEVLRVLRRYLAADAEAVRLVAIDWDPVTDEVHSIIDDSRIDATGEHQPKTEMLPEALPDEFRQTLVAEWKLQGREVDFIEDTAAASSERPLLGLSAQRGILANIVIPIYEDDRLYWQVNIPYAAPRRFDTRLRRLYTAIRDQIAVVLENQRLLRDTQSTAAKLGGQVRVLQTINRLASILTDLKDERVLLDQTCQALVNALGIGHANIALLDTNLATNVAHVVSEYPNMGGVGLEISPDNPLQAELRRDLRPVVVEDPTNDPRLQASTVRILNELGIKKVALLPLTDENGSYMGTVGLDIFDERVAISREMLDIARTISAQVGIRLQNLRYLDASQRTAQQFQQIAALGQLLQSTLDVDELLKVSLTSMARIVEADHITLALLNPADGGLEVVAERFDLEVRLHQEVRKVNIADTTLGRVFQTGERLRINDLDNTPDLRHALRQGIQSVLGLPIFSRGVVQGVVEIASLRRNAYSTAETAIFQQVVNQISVALENAEAYTQSQRLARSKALINDITSQLQRQNDLEQMLDVTMNELGKALGARRARVRLTTTTLLKDKKQSES